VLAVWVVVLGLAVVSAQHFTSHLSGRNNVVDGSDSQAAERALTRAFPQSPAETDFAVVHAETLTADDVAFRQVVTSAVTRYRSQPTVQQVVSPYDQPAMLISSDRHTALVAVGLTGDSLALQKAATGLQDVATGVGAWPVQVRFTGYSPLAAAGVAQANADLGRAESIGLPVAAVVLLLAFGSVVAAGIPLGLGVIAVLGAFGLLGLASPVMHFDSFVQTSVSMVGIALGIDYSLFIVTRFREELAALDDDTRDGRIGAVARTLATAGHAVLFSGSTVVIALLGLLLVRSPVIRTMAAGMVAAVVAMLLVAITLLPALLALLGRRVNRFALPGLRRALTRPDPERSVWARLAGLVMGRPVVIALVTGLGLAALAVPAAGLRYGVDLGTGSISDSAAGKGFATVSSAFAPGVVAPIDVVVSSPQALTDEQWNTVADYATSTATDRRVAQVASPTAVLDALTGGHTTATLARLRTSSPAALDGLVDRSAATAVLTVYPRAAADTTPTADLVHALRTRAAASLADRGLTVHVGGSPAQITDITAENSRATPLVVGAVLAASWVLLLLVFRSVVLPFKAILMNLLSVGAAFGIMVLVFQDGHGAGLLGVTRTGFIQVILPLFSFALIFGLSMDYEVFMLSRMREEWRRTGDNTLAVRLGITHTAGVISAAAAIMVVVFASFMFTASLEIKQMGFMLAVAVLLDATVVRLLLVPALMRLMGSWNWWFPRLRSAPRPR
jgi:RND superfamily putative drug exporter